MILNIVLAVFIVYVIIRIRINHVYSYIKQIENDSLLVIYYNLIMTNKVLDETSHSLSIAELGVFNTEMAKIIVNMNDIVKPHSKFQLLFLNSKYKIINTKLWKRVNDMKPSVQITNNLLQQIQTIITLKTMDILFPDKSNIEILSEELPPEIYNQMYNIQLWT